MTDSRIVLWRSRAAIIAIALLFFVPFILAWYYARHPELIESTSNYGTLIFPPQPLDPARLLARPVSRGEALPEIKGRWVLLQVATGPCGATCAETLYKTHQLRLMLNKDISRVRRLLLLPPGASTADLEAVLRKDEDLLVARIPESLPETLAASLGKPPGDNTVVLMDPLGNLVLWYEAGFDPYRLVKDLKHLLRTSQIG